MAVDGNGSLPQELKTQLDSFNGMLTGIRDKQGELEKQVKSRSGPDPLTKAALDKLQTGYDNLRDQINTAYKAARRPAVAHLDARSQAIETKANQEFARWMGVADPNAQAVIDARKAYTKAFVAWMRKGDGIGELEKKTLQVGEAPSGSFWVEPARADWIVTKIFESSVIRPFTRGITISTDSIKVPVDRQRTNAKWVGETSARTATTTAQIGEMMIAVHELYSQPAITQNMIDDGMVDIESWANDKIVQDFALSENAAFVTGNGVYQPRGFATYPTAATSDAAGRAFGTIERIGTAASGAWKTATATVSPADDILSLLYAFKAPYRPNLRLGGTRTTLGTIRRFKDQLGNFIAGPRLDQNRGIVETVFGYDYDELADMAELGANSLSVVAADWSKAYLIVDRLGMRQLRDPYTSKPNVLFDTTRRVGGDVMDTEALKFIYFG